MKQVKQVKQQEAEKLIFLISQSGQIAVRDCQLLVAPPSVAQKYGDQIRSLKPEILLAFGLCPVCAADQTFKIEDLRGKTRAHSYCSTPWHYDKWEALWS